MYRLATRAALAALIGLGSMSFSPIRASAQDLDIEMGRDGPRLRLRDECDPDREDCFRRDSRHNRDREGRRRCTEDRALDKADRMGLRRARVVSAGRRSIEVRGRDRSGDRVIVTFGRDRHCPIIG
jgi:hypothetical protein